MEIFRCFITLFFASFFLISGLWAQPASCYVRMEDASGYTPTSEQLVELEAAACALIDSFPAEFRDSFRVYDFGFYLHQEVTEGGYPEPFAKKIHEVQELMPYYLLFGKQTDRDGVYTKFWFALRFPSMGQFSCMTNLQRDVYTKRVEKITEGKYLELGKSIYAYSEAEIAGVQELKNIIHETKECCIENRYGVAQRSDGCDGCSDDLINAYFVLQGFSQINLDVITAPYANIKSNIIKDYSFNKVIVDNQTDYIGNILVDQMIEFNQWISVNLLVTSNPSLCIDSISGSNANLEQFKFSPNFLVQINLADAEASNSCGIKITWNKISNSWVNDDKTANLIIDIISCEIYDILNLVDENCSQYLSAPHWTENPDYYRDFSTCSALVGTGNLFGAINVPSPTKEINNGIEILSTWTDSYLTTGHLIATTPYRHPFKIVDGALQAPDDMYSEMDRDCGFIINDCMTRYEKHVLRGPNAGNTYYEPITLDGRKKLMYWLLDFHTQGSFKPIGRACVDRFFSHTGNLSDEEEYNTQAMLNNDLNHAVSITPEMRNFMKEFGMILNSKLRESEGSIYPIPDLKIPPIKRPIFNSTDHICTGLTILLNDTEQTKVWYDKGFSFDEETGIWSGDFFFEITDHFGLDKPDVVKAQKRPVVGDGFAAWWVLQHKDGYRPFKTKVFMYARLKGKLNP